MNIPYLLKILGTKKLSVLVENIDLPLIDINLAIWDAEKAGEIEINDKKDKVKLLIDPEVTFNSDLANKLMRVMRHYESQNINVTRGRLNQLVKNQGHQFNYPYHEYLMALQYLIDTEQVSEEIRSVPEIKDKRPYHKFVFLQFPDNPNDEWNRKEVDKWIANWNKSK